MKTIGLWHVSFASEWEVSVLARDPAEAATEARLTRTPGAKPHDRVTSVCLVEDVHLGPCIIADTLPVGLRPGS